MAGYKVFKFGGSSVKDAEHIKNVKSILEKYGNDKIVMVVSAMGKTTNALESVIDRMDDEHTLNRSIKGLIEDHLSIAKELDIDTNIYRLKLENLVQNAEDTINNHTSPSADFIYDQVVSLGELFSTSLIELYLNKNGLSAAWLDVRTVLKTDNDYRRAKVHFQRTNAEVNKCIPQIFESSDIIVTQGFIGESDEGYTTTLGREGSDYTAAIFAYCLDAEEVTIWKDVPGILTADPKRFENVEKIERMSYREAIEMTYYGAKVIHPKTIQPIQNKGIQLIVNSYLKPDKTGTIISDKGLLNYPPIVVIEDDVILMQISSKDFSFIQEDHLSHIFRRLKESNIALLAMRNSAISFTLCIKHPGDQKLDQFIELLGPQFGSDIFKGLQLLTVRHFQESLIQSLTEKKIVLFEEILKDTIRLAVKPALELKEKTNS
ncbi:MAG: aspartate kinase [Saprospiraceae bacterium]|nr:aspartate kinase [Saprospiraceae bacterium]